jgi:membrane protein required for colicin V production
MAWLDCAALGVIAISVAWGVWRGLVREVVSLAGWIIAFLAANLLAGPAGDALPESLGGPDVRVLVAFIGIFIVALAFATLVALLLRKMLKAAGLGGLDRTLGGIFGVARGLLVIVALGLLAGLTRLPADPAWKDSVTGPMLARTAAQLRPWLPPKLSERLRYQ